MLCCNKIRTYCAQDEDEESYITSAFVGGGWHASELFRVCQLASRSLPAPTQVVVTAMFYQICSTRPHWHGHPCYELRLQNHCL